MSFYIKLKCNLYLDMDLMLSFTNSVMLVLTMLKKVFQESRPIWFVLPRASDSANRSTMYANSLFIISFCTPDRWGYVAETGMEIEIWNKMIDKFDTYMLYKLLCEEVILTLLKKFWSFCRRYIVVLIDHNKWSGTSIRVQLFIHVFETFPK